MRIGGGAVSIADVTNRPARDLGFVRPFWLSEIRAGRAFTGGVSIASSVGDNTHIQLLNPAASGVTILVRRLVAAPKGVDAHSVRTHNTALTTLSMNGVNLLAGGTAGLGAIRTVNNAGLLGTLARAFTLLTDTPFDLIREWDFELGAGEGILIVPGSTNNGLAAFYDWIEV